jgi:glutamyl-tRNA synthetase
LHIGHAKAAILNATAAADYEGRLIVRFDDTNPSKEKAEFEESQLADLKTLGIAPDIVTYTSNYFDKIEEQCIELIKKGLAYCDDTDVPTAYPPSDILIVDETATYGWHCK